MKSARPARRSARRTALVEAAFAVLAEAGFEGLRTREVARRVGVNIATLHYYFATKDALVQAVVEELFCNQARLRATAGPAGDPAARLRELFAEARRVQFECPAVRTVALELRLRAERDPAVRRFFEPLVVRWRTALESVLAEGVKQGAFRADLDPGAAATMVLATLWGSPTQLGMNLARFERACAELERSFARRAPRRTVRGPSGRAGGRRLRAVSGAG